MDTRNPTKLSLRLAPNLPLLLVALNLVRAQGLAPSLSREPPGGGGVLGEVMPPPAAAIPRGLLEQTRAVLVPVYGSGCPQEGDSESPVSIRLKTGLEHVLNKHYVKPSNLN